MLTGYPSPTPLGLG